MIITNFEWEYKHHPQCDEILEKQHYELLKQLWSGSLDIKKSIIDTRDVHRHLFKDLTFGDEYFAGHYRGENYPYLQNYEVSIEGNPKVGYPSKSVLNYMLKFSDTMKVGINNLDSLHYSQATLGEKLRKTVKFASDAFMTITRIHPYANGNGHIGRFLLFSILFNYGYKVRNWTIDPRPPKPYIQLIQLYENGDKESLYRWILEQIPIP